VRCTPPRFLDQFVITHVKVALIVDTLMATSGLFKGGGAGSHPVYTRAFTHNTQLKNLNKQAPTGEVYVYFQEQNHPTADQPHPVAAGEVG